MAEPCSMKGCPADATKVITISGVQFLSCDAHEEPVKKEIKENWYHGIRVVPRITVAALPP